MNFFDRGRRFRCDDSRSFDDDVFASEFVDAFEFVDACDFDDTFELFVAVVVAIELVDVVDDTFESMDSAGLLDRLFDLDGCVVD